MALERGAGVRAVQLRSSRSGAGKAKAEPVEGVVTPKKRSAVRRTPKSKSMLAAAVDTVDAMRSAGELGDRDAASVAMVMALAAAVDADSGNAALWREFRAALGVLREAGGEAGDDDAEILSFVQSPVRPRVVDAT